MNRWLRRAPAFLVAGALLNIVLAWACALWSPVNAVRFRYSGGWPAAVPSDWSKPTMVTCRDSFGLTQISAMGPGPDAPRTRSGVAQQWAMRAGWPWRCLDRSRSTADIGLVVSPGSADAPPQSPTAAVFEEGLYLPDAVGKRLHIRADRALPIRPRLAAFIGNTSFFAAVLALLLFGFVSTRAALRRRRGLCPACAYNIAGLTTCPECGRKRS